ncbi:MAG: rRNA maturation RNase YbeY [Simkaniaceae bacterium]|nr:rRNA maturation RNase YbeY [Simkaniaceae bacterium]
MEKINRSQTCQKLPSAKVTLYQRQEECSVDLDEFRDAISSVLNSLKIDCDELIFHFVSIPEIERLHQAHFNDPSETDCITLPIDPPGCRESGYCLLGEAFICPKVAMKQAALFSDSYENELIRYGIHCLLHMIGYTDENDVARSEMKALEDLCLDKVRMSAVN